jgi:protein-tyrosine-phosphatase
MGFNPVAVAAMAELGIDITTATRKVLTGDAVQTNDVVITMGCGDACPYSRGCPTATGPAGASTLTEEQIGTTCCFATQDKVWVTGPGGERWEICTVLADSETFACGPEASATTACC